MEKCPTNLRDFVLNDGVLENEAAIQLTAHMCSALHFLKNNFVLHRCACPGTYLFLISVRSDIKPENILVQINADESRVYKLTDFGFAKQSNMADSQLGTPLYQAPEVSCSCPHCCTAPLIALQSPRLLWATRMRCDRARGNGCDELCPDRCLEHGRLALLGIHQEAHHQCS